MGAPVRRLLLKVNERKVKGGEGAREREKERGSEKRWPREGEGKRRGLKQYSRQGIKWPGVGECPVPFVSATCLKTSSLSLSLLSTLYLLSLFFSPRARIYEEEKDERERKREARSFDSTAFLLIRQTFDSFTWEPRNSSWWLPCSFFPDLSK